MRKKKKKNYGLFESVAQSIRLSFPHQKNVPSKDGTLINAGLMLGQRRRRWLVTPAECNQPVLYTGSLHVTVPLL